MTAYTAIPFRDWQCEVVNASFGRRPFQKHVHDEYSIGLITAGSNMFTLSSRQKVANAGEACICAPGDVHDGGLADAPWAYRNLFVPSELVQQILDEDNGATSDGPLASVVGDPVVVSALLTFHRALDHGMVDDVESLLIQLVLALFSGKERMTSAAGRPAASIATRIALEAMRDHKGRELTLEDLAKITGIGRTSLVRAVHRDTGLTPGAYMRSLKILEAKRLILSGVSLAGAAAEAGFSDQAHLTRTMRAHFGFTPRDLVVKN